MQYFFTALGVCGTLLQVAVIYAMTRSELRRFIGIFFYLLVLFLTTVADMSIYLQYGGWPDWYRQYYFINNTIRHVSAFIAVLSLIFAATAGHPRRQAFRFKIVLATLAGVAAILFFSPGETFPRYVNQVGRNLSFATALLNVVLWLSLIRSGLADRRLLFVSGGLGLNMAGQAIGQSMLEMGRSSWLGFFGNLIAIASHMVCLYIWWVAFRRVEVPRETAPAPLN